MKQFMLAVCGLASFSMGAVDVIARPVSLSPNLPDAWRG